MEEGQPGDAIFIQCPCRRGYFSSFFKPDGTTPMSFAIKEGYFLMIGYCDECHNLFFYRMNLADMLTLRASDWEPEIQYYNP